MRAILVAVDYTQELAITLPYNRHHFESVLVVTSPADEPNVRPVVEANGAGVFVTDAFYRQGAAFNKFLALEEGLDHMGRSGWLCLMDADVLWPTETKLWLGNHPACEGGDDCWCGGGGYAKADRFVLHFGQLCTPLRRMMVDLTRPVPPEHEWPRFPLHPNRAEWPGYSQIFNADDPHLGEPPWHDVRYTHAGTADSLFQRKWPASDKVRPPFEALHLGPSGANWLGRVTPRVDGTVPEGAAARRQALREMIRQRRPGPDPYRAERLP